MSPTFPMSIRASILTLPYCSHPGTTELTALLGMGNLALYALPYTLSKTRTEANTWIGALVGAVPPLMGWAAATQCTLPELMR